jgi:two-component system alkaline phosphatase synthesis response regulator PhoP
MIFCVEDDASLRDLMLHALQSVGFAGKGLPDGAALFETLETELPRLILLDIVLPGEDGLTILKRLRDHPATAAVPVIMATSRGTEYDKVKGLELGADDYLTKPFGMMEMVSRVKAVLRRTEPKERGGCLQVGRLQLYPEAHTVLSCGRRVQLTRKEYYMLLLFMEHLGSVFTREQILRKIWGTSYMGESRTVDVHIGTLRMKLGACGGYIETVRGVGYRMDGNHG